MGNYQRIVYVFLRYLGYNVLWNLADWRDFTSLGSLVWNWLTREVTFLNLVSLNRSFSLSFSSKLLDKVPEST